MNLKAKIGVRIAELRKERKLSQQKFAYTAELDRAHITNIEKGNKNISLSTFEKILSALEITPKDFFNTESFN